MENYTDEELVETIKQWWKANGSAIIAGIAIGLVVIFGWRFWTSHRLAQAEDASLHYDNLLQSLTRNNAADALRQGQELFDDYSGSPYADLAALQLAKQAVADKKMPEAIAQLEWIVDHADMDEIRDIAHLRLARVLLDQGRLDEADKQLTSVQDQSFNVELEELRGDLYLARKQPEEARTAYQAALSAGGNNFLQLKLADLAPPKQEK
ncbi:MAG: tetratricopeptide repeat protein [Gammaproteobacteria bacterium]|nr:tetratricopeptide repeat protein [Gammaproteobacteria bacterium]MCP5458498.1 tetratricopeptide repeat protein [Gammaproteobacteria bacterium]